MVIIYICVSPVEKWQVRVAFWLVHHRKGNWIEFNAQNKYRQQLLIQKAGGSGPFPKWSLKRYLHTSERFESGEILGGGGDKVR